MSEHAADSGRADRPRWREAPAELKREPLLAVDTEAASFHRYLDRVYLVQLSSRSGTVVVDPLAAGDLAPFGRVLADPTVEVVFHDADYDLRLLDQQYGFGATRLFDTRVAAQLLNEPGIGLAALLEKYQGYPPGQAIPARGLVGPAAVSRRCWPTRHPIPGTCRSCGTSWPASWRRGAGWAGPRRSSPS